MDLVTRYGGKEYLIDIAHPCDISIVLQNGFPRVNAFRTSIHYEAYDFR